MPHPDPPDPPAAPAAPATPVPMPGPASAPAAVPAAATPSATAAPRRCENCGSPLYGTHCYACGQPIKGMVRHFSSILGDFVDTVFNIDSRVLRTLGPLLTRPGFLSLEYFAGRRVRYVTPMRLFLFLSLIAFFAIQGSIEFDERDADGNAGASRVRVAGAEPVRVEVGEDDFTRAKTAAEVRALRDDALARLDEARAKVANVPGASVGMDIASEEVRKQAQDRLDELRAAGRAARPAAPGATGATGAAGTAGTAGATPGAQTPSASEIGDDARGATRKKSRNFNFPVNGKPWDPKTNPISFGWLPAAANQSLNRRMAHARDVLDASDSEKPFVDALFNVLPQTLIVLMPLFALMLKLAYLFKRRLYMEHLIVALHSHSFISLALILVLLFAWLQEWLAPSPGAWNTVFGWGIGLTSAWIPVYLLLMQKRVYGQGWVMTLLKFGVLGICYSVLLGIGLLAAMLVGLLTL
jgi:hypothetical protein